MTQPIREGFHTVTPTAVFKDVRKAIDFYKKAFGATENFAMPGPGGQGIMHAEITIGGSRIMMGEEHPERSQCRSAETAGGSPVSFYLYVKDVDAAFRRAVEAGAKEQMAVNDMFWGDRMGSLTDPFGYAWMVATHIADPTPEEIRQGAEAAFAGAGNR
jgi:PhnB protein